MINYLKNTIKNDSQLIGIHSTIKKNQLDGADFGTILSIYLAEYINQAIETCYQGPFIKDQHGSLANLKN